MANDYSNRAPKRRGDGSSWASGVDNRSHETKLADGYVRHADNVEIDQNGITRSRDGYALWAPLAGAHSLWTHELLTFALVANATTLYRLDEGGALTALVTGLNGSPLSYAAVGHRVRWSNRVQTGVVDMDGTPAALGVQTPLPSFGVAAVANGGLFAGRYGVTMTFASASREEGGAPESVYVDVPDGGGLQITGVPVASDGSATEARIYVTEANGIDLMHAGSAQPGAATFLVGAGNRARLLSTQFCEPFPPAACLLAQSGRLLGALGRDLVWSQALYYGLYRPTRNSLRFPDEIVMLAAPETDGFMVYVGTRKAVYLLRGDSIDTCVRTVACAAGVIPGSMNTVPAEAAKLDGVLTPVPFWVGADGVPYAGLIAGVIPLSSVFAYPIYDEAAAAFVQQDGLSRYIVSGRGGRTSGLAMGDYASLEVVTDGP